MKRTAAPFARSRFVVAAIAVVAAALLAASPATAKSSVSLDAAMAALDRSVAFAGTAWGVDAARNQVVVSVDASVNGARLAKVVAAVDRLGGSARLQSVAGRFDVRISGGDAIYGGQYRCSLGFNVMDSSGAHYFLTAGHCGNVASSWYANSNHTTLLGSVVSSRFPRTDYAIVRYASSFTNYPGTVGSQDISSAGNATVGETVTRRGSTTGVHSGRVTALNVTVHYASGGTVKGLIQTTVCAEPGDSGGPLYDGTVALGLTSGGSGDCTRGGTTFFQPVIPALNAFGVHVY